MPASHRSPTEPAVLMQSTAMAKPTVMKISQKSERHQIQEDQRCQASRYDDSRPTADLERPQP